MTGIARLSVEFVRLNPKVLWGLTPAQIISVVLMVVGVGGVVYLLRIKPPDPSPSPSGPSPSASG
jgi:prolipoprotein diacylglyceryltransferase